MDPLELAADRLRDGLHGKRLRETGHTLNEEVAAREQRHDHALEQVVLADDDLLDLEEQALHLAAGADTRRHRFFLPSPVGCRVRPMPRRS